MKKDCFYRVKVTKIKFDGSYYFPKRTDTWWIGRFTWKQVLAYVNEWYERSADAVELKMITEEEFYEQLPKSPYS